MAERRVVWETRTEEEVSDRHRGDIEKGNELLVSLIPATDDLIVTVTSLSSSVGYSAART